MKYDRVLCGESDESLVAAESGSEAENDRESGGWRS